MSNHIEINLKQKIDLDLAINLLKENKRVYLHDLRKGRSFANKIYTEKH